MKKIVSAALVASMVAGAAFATEAKITLNYRTKLDAFSYKKASAGDVDTISREWLDWAGYDGAGAQTASAPSDTFKFVLDGDNAGAAFAVNLNTNASAYTLNQYSAWMKWALGPGELKLESGNWKDGYADGSYRVKKDVDAQNAEGMDFERFKLGSILKGNKITFADELGASNSKLAGYAEYTLPLDSMKLKFLAGGVQTDFDTIVETETNETTTTYYDSYFVSRVQLAMDVLNAELIYKKPSTRNNTFALYVMPKLLDNLTLNVGGALDICSDPDEADKYTDWGFDLRARYALDANLSLTFFTNLSGTDLDKGRKLSSGIAGHKGANGWATANAVKTAMWNNLSARYKVNDALAATLNFGLITPLSKAKDDNNSYSPEWRVTPAVQVYTGSNASVWAGIALSGASWTVSGADRKSVV